MVTAVDVSPEALVLARRNAAAHGVAGRIFWVEAPLADWLAGPAPNGGAGIDLLVANLPYVPTGELASLVPEVRLHEPRTALDGGPDGLGPLRELLHAVPLRLNPPRGSSSRSAWVRPTRSAISSPRPGEWNCWTFDPTFRAFRGPP